MSYGRQKDTVLPLCSVNMQIPVKVHFWHINSFKIMKDNDFLFRKNLRKLKSLYNLWYYLCHNWKNQACRTDNKKHVVRNQRNYSSLWLMLKFPFIGKWIKVTLKPNEYIKNANYYNNYFKLVLKENVRGALFGVSYWPLWHFTILYIISSFTNGF